MKRCNLISSIICALVLSGGVATSAEPRPGGFVSETEFELVSTGDFDGDGRLDLVIVDRPSGKYRLGYQAATGALSWAEFRTSGLKDVTSITVGKFLAPNRDTILATAADANQVILLDVSNPATVVDPIPVPFSALGPGAPVAVDIGGAGNTPLHDLFIVSTYATPPKAFLMRNQDGKFTALGEFNLDAPPARANRLALKPGQPEVICFTINGDEGDLFRIEDLSSGKAVNVATLKGLPGSTDYAFGQFKPGSLGFIFFKAGESNLIYYPLQESGGTFQFGAAQTFTLNEPIRLLAAVPAGNASKLVISLGKGETAGLYNFDGSKAPALTQTLTNQVKEFFFGVTEFPNGFVILSAQEYGKYSGRYRIFQIEGDQADLKLYGGITTLEESDIGTVALIHKRITESSDVKEQSQMQPYTNTIYGTPIKFVMLPIPGGEFVMGSPDSEKGRKPDEGPQHKVKIAPFWMGKFEVTWNEYELFMFPEDEKRYRANFKTEEYVNKVSDAVSRPSKPYTDMSFGMGKDGYPAIAMTQHGANKYCHWLSAKTGQFYRLPTEAEWEYACRAGTTTAYSFGDDPKQLEQFGWYGKNSDWKYQKIGKKKPNPWGLHDIHGNVLEWCLDQYDPNYYKQFADKMAQDPWLKAAQPYPHAARGGCWDDDDATALRSAARRGSDRAWKMQDPQLPKSFWYLSDAQFIGFRLVRPLEVPSPDQMAKCWISGVERD